MSWHDGAGLQPSGIEIEMKKSGKAVVENERSKRYLEDCWKTGADYESGKAADEEER